jgi:hypothetical protein
LVPIAVFTPEIVNTGFGSEVNECKFKRMKTLLHLWHHLHDSGIAHFGFVGPRNVWGFHSVHVVDREKWDASVLATARGIARNVGGKPAKHPVQSIYEIIQYCGMTVVRGNRATSGSNSQQPRVDKKALDQDDYVFSEHAFSTKKHRATKGW